MLNELEWQTRRDRIDKKLTALHPQWEIINYSPFIKTNTLSCHAVREYPTENGPADYALFMQGKLIGIIEAKKVGVSPQNVLEQAKRYSRGIRTDAGQWGEYGVPFLYATNGEVIWFIDVRDPHSLSRQISDFHTSPSLSEMFCKEILGEDDFQSIPFNDRLRYYQLKVLQDIETAIINKKRAMLLAMATGTGKTFTIVSSIYRLLESKQFRRILFLVDRRALAAQAVREFSTFSTPKGNKFDQEYEVYSQRFRKEDFGEEDHFDPKVLPTKYLTEPDETKTFVYISTIQRMTINLFGWERAFDQDANDPDYEEDTETFDTPIPIHAFDLIIADECHRGYTAKETAIWRSTLEYFDAIKIGLTATPAAHSLSFFKEVISRYSTDEAIADGYLVDYEAIKISSGVLMKGAFLKEGEHVGIIDTRTGHETYDELEDERAYSTEEIEKKITAPDTNVKIIKQIAKYAYEHEQQTGRFPKILIFASNDLPFTSHADQLVKICREEFNQGDAFVQKITGSPNVDRPLQRIREFRNRPNPKIVVTVDMLSTGVDVPAIEFIVFLRAVKSRILWVQMLGRGTRICPGINKDHFKVFDCFDGTLINYFNKTTDFNIEPPLKDPLTIKQIIENIYQNVSRDYYIKILVKRLRRIEKTMSGEAREMFAMYIKDGDIGKFASDLPGMLKNDFTGTMKLLRDEKFQELLVNYPRPVRDFVIGYEIEDTVTSERLILGEKPKDYLDSFIKFVKENPDQITAIRILLEKPKEWNTEALNELREKLRSKKFPEKYLQEAHKIVYHKALADIISMVKHAAKEAEPILTAEERVNAAFEKITADRHFDYEQNKWLNFIREHLIQNLTIGEDDFNYSPVFERNGGLRKAQRIFGKEELKTLINEINFAMAA